MLVFRPRIALLAALLAPTLAACGSGGTSSDGAVTRVPVAIGEVNVTSAGTGVRLSDAEKEAVATTLTRYITAATASPLRTNTVGADLADAFEEPALTAATGPDRAALIDDGYPAGNVAVDPVNAQLDVLADANGQVAIIAATMTVNARSTTDKGPIQISRVGTYILHPDAVGWQIHAYDVRVTRDLPDGLTTTTSARR